MDFPDKGPVIWRHLSAQSVIIAILWDIRVVCSFTFALNTPALQWHHNGHDGVSNHWRIDCLLNRLFRRTSKKISSVTGLREWGPPVTGGFPSQRAWGNSENISILWRPHGLLPCCNRNREYIHRRFLEWKLSVWYSCLVHPSVRDKRRVSEIDLSQPRHETAFSWRHNGPVTSQSTDRIKWPNQC